MPEQKRISKYLLDFAVLNYAVLDFDSKNFCSDVRKFKFGINIFLIQPTSINFNNNILKVH